MQLTLENKVYMVAGGSKGLGFAIAKALVLEGAQVSLASREPSHLEAAKAELLSLKPDAKIQLQSCDVSKADDIDAWASAVNAELHRLDGLVVNAGGPPPGMFDDFDDAAWQRAFNLTLMSAVRLVRNCLPALRKQGGSILMLSSSSVKEPIDFLLLSNVMRSGVSALAKSLSKQLAADRIRVNNLVPGLIATERMDQLDQNQAQAKGISAVEQRREVSAMIPLQRYGEPDEFGRAGAFLLSPVASYITGASLVIDGGTMKSV